MSEHVVDCSEPHGTYMNINVFLYKPHGTYMNINVFLYEPRQSVDVVSLSNNGKEVRRRAILEFERRFMENQTELMALLLDPCTKGNTSIMSRKRWNDARLLLRKEYIDIHTTIKLSEYMQLKEKMKGLV